MARILVLDDNVALCKWITHILEKNGYDTLEAYDVEQGVKLLQENHADLLILDIFMPKQGGISTLIQVRNDFPEMKMIVVSGGGGSKHVDFFQMAKDLGAHRLLQKPFTKEELLETVRDLLH